MSTTAPALGARVGEIKWQSKIYKAVATPINFVAFLLSLYLIDNHYRARRHDQHEASERTWLSRFLYQQPSSPYEWVENHQGRSLQSTNAGPHHDDKTKNASVSRSTGGPWFYHTKQRKLFKLEAADAFALRNSVLVAISILTILVVWVLWRTVIWLAAWGWNWLIVARS